MDSLPVRKQHHKVHSHQYRTKKQSNPQRNFDGREKDSIHVGHEMHPRWAIPHERINTGWEPKRKGFFEKKDSLRLYSINRITQGNFQNFPTRHAQLSSLSRFFRENKLEIGHLYHHRSTSTNDIDTVT